ncbi:hypothetical protein OCOJLMKI_4558 [Methylobacterium iners]|uniref:Uncharacterized protein n=1 Tax=Methylobacterium iners TaxID=418707 RepID=A0ABQ4S2M6_9HYPH|nr:hypothetical protein OCOJLMKI_4558 [Methylobacterium iners]
MRSTVTGFLIAAWLAPTVFLPLHVLAQEGAPTPPLDAATGKPANLCQELVAFVQQPDPAKKADPQPAQLASAVQAPKADSAESKPAAQGTAQNTSGQSGQITQSGPGAAGPQGGTQNAAAPSGASGNATPSSNATQAAQTQAAPPPAGPATPVAPKPTPEAIEQVKAAARSNDLSACRSAAQQMRRAGVAMPAPLLALSAMDLNLLQAASQP